MTPAAPQVFALPEADTPAAADTGAVPRFTSPDHAVQALAQAARYARRRSAPPDPPLIAAAEGALVVDARIRLEAPGRSPAVPSPNA